MDSFLEKPDKIAETMITAEEYLKRGFKRLDWVHMSTKVEPEHNARERLIITRLQALRDGGMKVHEIGSDLEEDLQDIEGEMVVVGGATELCCGLRKSFIREKGGTVIVDYALVTNY